MTGKDASLRRAGEDVPKHMLNIRDADIRTLIETVAEVTGRNFIVDPRVNGQVRVISLRPMGANRSIANNYAAKSNGSNQPAPGVGSSGY